MSISFSCCNFYKKIFNFRLLRWIENFQWNFLHLNLLIFGMTRDRDYHIEMYIKPFSSKKTRKIRENLYIFHISRGKKMYHAIRERQRENEEKTNTNERRKKIVKKNLSEVESRVHVTWRFVVKGRQHKLNSRYMLVCCLCCLCCCRIFYISFSRPRRWFYAVSLDSKRSQFFDFTHPGAARCFAHVVSLLRKHTPKRRYSRRRRSRSVWAWKYHLWVLYVSLSRLAHLFFLTQSRV